MTKITGMLLLLIGIAGLASGSPTPVPEIDPVSGVSALALLSGTLVVMLRRRRK